MSASTGIRLNARGRGVLALAALTLPASAAAHGFGRLYNLPVPFWLYAWAAGAALLLSFVLAAYFATAPAPEDERRAPVARSGVGLGPLQRLLPALKLVSVAMLLLSIATGWWGNRDPYRNFSMTGFWVVFLLAFTYFTALCGNVYAALNPWRVMADALGRLLRGYGAGRLRYPERLGMWPALVLYMALIWFELFGHGKPSPLASMLFGYSLLNLFGVWLVGTTAWFRHCELFSVYLRLIGLMAPLRWQRSESDQAIHLRWRAPFSGLMEHRPQRISVVIFALAMLSTTAFDGLRATQWWVGLFWRDPSGIVTALAGKAPILAYPVLRPWYIAWETFWLLASPFIYLGAYILCMALAKLLTRSTRSVRDLALDFGYTLLPIALVYHMTHYATLALTQGLKIISLLSDPFGWGWDLFGTATLLRAPILPSMGLVWHSQVGLILLGHIVSVYVAHRVALRIWPSRGQALLSQLPMLILMIGFTVTGLWILAQPLTAELLR